jgi:transcriptional regulator with XRE-family HTH domain
VTGKKNLKEIFGAKLTFLMKRDGVKQKDLAPYLKVHQTQIGKYMSGENFPDIDKWEKLSIKFKVSPIYFIDPSSGIDDDPEVVALLKQRIQTLRVLLKDTEKAQVAASADREIQDKLLDVRDKQLARLSMHT